MRKPLEPGSDSSRIVDDEVDILARVRALLHKRAQGQNAPQGMTAQDFDAELLALRDQIAEERLEDLPMLMQHMTQLQALASTQRGRQVSAPVDIGSPYFAHMRLVTDEGKTTRDILVGRRGLIDRSANVQIVDWRDAPISQVYYRYDEGDDYEEPVAGSTFLKGIVEARRNVVVHKGVLRRISCPQGVFVGSGEGAWSEIEGMEASTLAGGQGTAARPPRATGPAPKGKRRLETASRIGDSKQLPEIAALIDREQFDLITAPSSGMVVIQGGAGSGKTTVALHRIAYLVFERGGGGAHAMRPSRCLFTVPSEALARYCSGVLPALGVNGVPVTTFRAWARTLRKRLVPKAPDSYSTETPNAVSRLKKHPAMLRLVEDAMRHEIETAREYLAERVRGADGEAWVLAQWDERKDRAPVIRARGTRGAVEKRAKADPVMLPLPTAHRAERALRTLGKRLGDVRRILFELYTDCGRLQVLRAAAIEPATQPELEELVRWSSSQLEEELPVELEGTDEENLTTVDGRPIDDSQEGAAARGHLDVEDDALLLRLFQLAHGQLERVDGAPMIYDHIAIDEAQDLAASEIKLLVEATDERRSVTIAGDVAQRVIFDNAFRGWSELLSDIGVAHAAEIRPLRLAYRSTAQVMRFARAVLGPLAPAESEVVARIGAEVSLHRFEGLGEAVGFVAESLRSLLAREPSSSVALIARHAGIADAWFPALQRAEVPLLRRVRRQDFVFTAGVDVTDVGQVKGLEFDYVILLDVTAQSYPDTVESRHLLHIAATRATHQLWLISPGTPSELVPVDGVMWESEDDVRLVEEEAREG